MNIDTDPCDFLKDANTQQIIKLFNATIPESNPANKYPLIFSIINPQFYFLNIKAESFQKEPDHELVGFFTETEINNAALMQDRINTLRSIWCPGSQQTS